MSGGDSLGHEDGRPRRSEREIAEWLISRTAELLAVEPGSLSPDEPFTELGLSSMQAVELSGYLERWAGVPISPTLAYDHPTITDAARHLAPPATGTKGETRPATPEVTAATPIAIVGIGCRLPGGDGVERFWNVLREGVDAIREVPANRWDGEALYDPDPDAPGKMNTRWGGFLDDVEGFDADFFAISAREAARMDPQQRIALEVAWEALEDAGIAPGGLSGSRTGVFVGASTFDHGAGLLGSGVPAEAYDGTGAALSVIANRLSYCLNLRGPSLVIDTACSSSLVAVHYACQALRNGEADLALAGGINVITSPRIALSFSRGRLMAPDGRCKPFDHRADGYVRSEGAGVVVLKPLPAALADGDRVYAVIRGGAVNQDGRTNGLAAPNRPAQEAVLRAAYAAAGVEPGTVDYVEAHGTGTAVGDPIEVGALATVLGRDRSPDRPLRVGSAKSNIGHTEAAAGVSGLIKTALALHHGELPPTVHFEKPNPLLGLDRLPIAVQAEAASWPERSDAALATAGVSSFGFGGTNAHLVLTSRPEEDALESEAGRGPWLFAVSGRTASGLRRRAAGWARAARANADDPAWLPRAAAAAARRADHDRHRAAAVVADAAELAAAMDALAEGHRAPGLSGPHEAARRAQRPALVFPGQGAQWAGMGKGLADAFPAFRDAIRRCDAEISRLLGRSVWSDADGLVAEGTANVQPALFAYQVALAETWRALGLEPAAVIGHSMGEIAAAHVAGALSLADAARVVCERSALLTEISGRGGLALVELDAGEASRAIGGREDELSIAAVNGPRATVLSGDPDALGEVVAALEARGGFARRVAVDFAAHSPHVEPLRPRLRAALAGIEPRTADTMIYSTVTSEAVAGTDLGPDYWARNVRETVLFSPTLERLLAEGYETFVELAPHPVLTRSVAELADHTGRPATVISSVRRDEDEARGLLLALAELYTRGGSVAWAAMYPRAPHLGVPAQGWDRRRFPLLDPAGGEKAGGAGRPWRGTLLGRRIRVGGEADVRLWPLPGDLATAPELADHLVDGTPLVPGAYWLSAALDAAADSPDARGSGSVALEGVVFARPSVVDDTDPDLQIALRPLGPGRSSFLITSDRGGGTVAHAHGVAVADGGPAGPHPSVEDLTTAPLAAVAPGEPYARLETAGLTYGERFRGLAGPRAGGGAAVAAIRLPRGLDTGCAPLHPALLDVCFHTVAAAAGDRLGDGVLPLPAGADRVWARTGTAPLREGHCHAVIRSAGPRELSADVTVLDERGEPVCSVIGLRVGLVARRPAEQGRLYAVRWDPVEPSPAESDAPGGWLVVTADEGAGRDLAARLAADGETCVVAAPDASGDALSLARGHGAVLAEAEARLGALRGVVDLRAMTDDGEPDTAALSGRAAAALDLARALTGRDWATEPPRLWLATSAARARTGSVLWGLGQTIANEHPELACSVIDAEPGQTDAVARALRTVAEPGRFSIRAGTVLEPRLAAAPNGGGGGTPIGPHGEYLITGGHGALGLHVARWLVSRGARRLLLLGRGAPGPAAERTMRELRAAGALVRGERGDVADADRLAEVIASSPDLTGVFHLAGTLEDALIGTLDEDALRRALSGKAAGAWNLHRLTLDRPIEHFVLFSSLAGLFGAPGQGAYAAANTFIDALAESRVAEGLPAQSIAWGTWAGSGLAADGGGADRMAARGMPPLDPGVAVELLDAALATGETQVAAAAFDWAEFGGAGLGSGARRLVRGFAARPDGTAAERGAVRHAVLTAATGAERLDALRAFLLGETAAVLGRPAAEVDTSVPLQELGFDSLMAMELRTRLESGLDIRLSATVVYTFPTVEALAEGLLDRIGGARPSQAAEEAPPVDADPLHDVDDAELAALLSAELDLHREMDT
ncbi:type I polyketide synthase [Spongiactinospora sp. TRM90649]|uniref:type I polyketide synthase n=1 Tax=Spongiactinospora sp. TRM90649 TaxID=3031114 RepID=UPI0023F6FC5C|nr:type I polyketide synthase [Spongiactinospora sp. TRM90649]MDF5752447.1 SDR family NAD(P)-dependent oxidoreductase [Spongiactinospora sp. TRM90649]